jgi:hypothetical protein
VEVDTKSPYDITINAMMLRGTIGISVYLRRWRRMPGFEEFCAILPNDTPINHGHEGQISNLVSIEPVLEDHLRQYFGSI